jgi:hypothetical protein
MLSKGFGDAIKKSAEPGRNSFVRVAEPSQTGDPFYVYTQNSCRSSRGQDTGEVSGGLPRKLSKILKRMVGPSGLEPETSTVSKTPPEHQSPLFDPNLFLFCMRCDKVK